MYAEALERQVALYRLMQSAKGAELLRRIFGDRIARSVRQSATHIASSPGEGVSWVREMLITMLREAEPFWWSSELTAAAAEMAASMPSWTLTEADAPAFAGFFWFASPVALPDYIDKPGNSLRAIAWHPMTDKHSGRLCVQFAYLMDTGMSNYPALPGVAWGWPVGATLEAAEAEAVTNAQNRPRVRAMCRFTAACWALLAQQLYLAPRERADRATARRLKREGWEPEPLIRVVQLRRVVHPQAQTGDPEPVAWSCRWIVRGHWRQQPYGPGHAQRRPTWITPYVKGPEEQPLKTPRATIFAVRR